MKERERLGELDIDGRRILGWFSRKYSMRAWSSLVCFKIVASGLIWWIGYRNSKLHKIAGSFPQHLSDYQLIKSSFFRTITHFRSVLRVTNAWKCISTHSIRLRSMHKNKFIIFVIIIIIIVVNVMWFVIRFSVYWFPCASWFPCVYKQMLRWFPRFQVATTCFLVSLCL